MFCLDNIKCLFGNLSRALIVVSRRFQARILIRHGDRTFEDKESRGGSFDRRTGLIICRSMDNDCPESRQPVGVPTLF